MTAEAAEVVVVVVVVATASAEEEEEAREKGEFLADSVENPAEILERRFRRE